MMLGLNMLLILGVVFIPLHGHIVRREHIYTPATKGSWTRADGPRSTAADRRNAGTPMRYRFLGPIRTLSSIYRSTNVYLAPCGN